MPALCYAELSEQGRSTAPGTLLMLHGVTRCWRDWDTILPALASTWRVLALDHRGHGGSERAASYLVVDYVSDAVRFVREQVAAPLVVCGHSLGGMVAAGVAAEVRELVRAVVLEDPPFHTMGQRILRSGWQAQFLGVREAARRGGSIEELTEAISQIRLPSGGGFKTLGELRDRASLRWMAECVTHLDPEVLTPVIEGRWLDGFDVEQTLSRMRCPALLLQADSLAGGALTEGDAERAAAGMPSCKRVKFAGIPHQIHRTCPERMLGEIEEFTKGLS